MKTEIKIRKLLRRLKRETLGDEEEEVPTFYLYYFLLGGDLANGLIKLLVKDLFVNHFYCPLNAKTQSEYYL